MADDDGIEKVPVNFRMEKALVDKVKEEASRRGSSTTDTSIYVEAVKFYFENKDCVVFSSPDEIDRKIERKFQELLVDKKLLRALRDAFFKI